MLSPAMMFQADVESFLMSSMGSTASPSAGLCPDELMLSILTWAYHFLVDCVLSIMRIDREILEGDTINHPIKPEPPRLSTAEPVRSM